MSEGPLQLVVPKGNPGFAKTLREYADQIESGEIVNCIVVCEHANGGVMERAGDWNDRWRLLGALEYAKDAVHKGS